MKFKNITELNESARNFLEGYFASVEVEAEISRFIRHSSGHWYFVLKDERSAINATMFKGANAKVDFIPKDGIKVLAQGKLSIYSPSGSYQINLSSMRLAGVGDMDAAFKELCAKLEAQGLIARGYNGALAKVGARALPRFAKRVGIVTSLGSAAFADMKNRIENSGYFLSEFICFDTLVQGKDAPASIINALKKADNAGLDVIILARGGGSKEDLWCFNDEQLAFEILRLKTPIISAVGHEIDYSISDFVSDHRSITPTASIDDLLPNRAGLEQFIDMQTTKIANNLSSKIKQANIRIELANSKLSPSFLARRLELFSLRTHTAQNTIKKAFEQKIALNLARLKNLQDLLNAKYEIIEAKRGQIEIFMDNKKICLDELQMFDEITLKSAYACKKAQILG